MVAFSIFLIQGNLTQAFESISISGVPSNHNFLYGKLQESKESHNNGNSDHHHVNNILFGKDFSQKFFKLTENAVIHISTSCLKSLFDKLYLLHFQVE